MRTKDIMMRFLDTYSGTSIGSHTLQIQIPIFAKNVYGKNVNPETISRVWRNLRSDKNFLAKNGYSIIESLEDKGREKKFIIRRTSEIHRDSPTVSEQTGDSNSINRSKELPAATTGAV